MLLAVVFAVRSLTVAKERELWTTLLAERVKRRGGLVPHLIVRWEDSELPLRHYPELWGIIWA